MAQIGSKIKAGFYATPERQGEYLRSLLVFNHTAAAFDPTCGEGHILKQLTRLEDDYSTEVNTYGVELDKGRATTAKTILNNVVEAPIESMVISHDAFGLVLLNPPYDHTMLGYGDEQTERKEYIELVRNTRYLADGGVMIYIIPSYRFADNKIARFLASYFEDVAITKFTDEDYPDFRQCVFIGKKKQSVHKMLNKKMFEFLIRMENEEFIYRHVTPIDRLVKVNKQWEIPAGNPNVRTFYSKIENKKDFVELIRNNKGFESFVARTKPKELEISGDPLINISQGQMALLLASGAVNGLLGDGDTLHAVQGMEIVSNVITEEETEHSRITKTRTKRDVSVKIITPSGIVKKLM